MSNRVSDHLRGNVVGYVALFVALSGTAWAAATIGARDIKPDAVRSKHIKNGEVTRADVAIDGSGEELTGQNLDESTLSGVDAETLDGQDSSAFLGAAAKAADADKLDGRDSIQFGTGVLSGRINGLPAGTTSMFASPSGVSTASAGRFGVYNKTPSADSVARGLSVGMARSMNAGESREFILEVAGQDTALRCTMGLGQNDCNDGSTAVAVPGNTGYGIRIASTNGGFAGEEAAFGLLMRMPASP